MTENCKTLIIGRGTVGVKYGIIEKAWPVILISKLNKTCEIGKPYTGEDVKEDAVELVFSNEEGLDVMIQALQECKQFFKPVPPELRMGA